MGQSCMSRQRDRSPSPPAARESALPPLVVPPQSPLDCSIQRTRARLAPRGRSKPTSFTASITFSSSLPDNVHLELNPMPTLAPIPLPLPLPVQNGPAEPVPPAAPPVSILVHRNSDHIDSAPTQTQAQTNTQAQRPASAHLSRSTQSLPAQSVAQRATTGPVSPAAAISLPALLDTPIEQWKVEHAVAWVRSLISTISPRSIDGVVRCFETARVDGALLMRIKSADLKAMLVASSPPICATERESKQLRTDLKKQLKALRVRARKLREQNKKLERSSSNRSNASQVALPMSEQKRSSFLPFRRTSSLRKTAAAASTAPNAPAVTASGAAPENSNSPSKRHSGSSTSASIVDASSAAPPESEA